jgi:hypothetical protein
VNTGIQTAKKNWPNQEWALIAIATLNPLDEIFARNYIPPATAINNVV